MKSVIAWAIRNSPAMNTLMASVLIVGTLSLFLLRREVFPEFELEMVVVSVPYPGASPDEVEEGICQKIEEAVRSIDGIKKQTAIAQEGMGSVMLELDAETDVQRTLNDVRSEVDRIPSFPLLAEDPEVKQITFREAVIQIGVIGPESGDFESELRLREVAEGIRNDLIRLPLVSQAELVGAKEYQIDIEISEDTLRRYGLTLQDVAQIVRRENLELPGGTIRTDAEEVLIRGKNKRLFGDEIRKIPLVTQPGGVVLSIGELGVVRDEFVDVTSFHRIDGKPGMVISVNRTTSEDLLAMTSAVKDYIAAKRLPPGYEMVTWSDASIEVRERLELLARNGIQGLILVLIVLAVFLELRLAAWVALGIPISILGTCAVMMYTGETLNMLTTFAFLMALGIVVDDAIVIGENIYTHRQRGVPFLRAAIDGTAEVLPSVLASVGTTIIAFMPLLFVTGVMGKFIAAMPAAMISMLVISLIESAFILPCHLGHSSLDENGNQGSTRLTDRARHRLSRLPKPARGLVGLVVIPLTLVAEQFAYPFRRIGDFFRFVNRYSHRGLDWFIARVYVPTLRFSLRNPAIVLSAAVALLMISWGFVAGGIVPWVVFPKMDSNTIVAAITFPDGTPADETDRATRRIEAAYLEIAREYEEQGLPIARFTRRTVGQGSSRGGPADAGNGPSNGSHLGSVTAELIETSNRPVSSYDVIRRWRETVGEIAGVESMTFRSLERAPGGTPIEFKLLAKPEDMEQLEEAISRTKAHLADYPGLFDVADDSRPGKWEFQLRVADEALAMGVPMADLAETVRAAYYGEEVMRLQRGRHEVKLMVRYPREERRSLADFDQIRVRTGGGAERPVTELAKIDVERGFSEINRVDQLRSITLSADVDETLGNAQETVDDLRREFIPEMLAEFPGVSVRWEGQQEQTTESIRSLIAGFYVALFAMFVLLTLEFRSYLQPLLVLSIVPFGAIGAIAGHALMGKPLTMFSLFGLVALTGVVVNDSIVLIDFINHRVRSGMPLFEALVDAGRRRFRPVLLTSVTTIAGLLPILLERSIQAQIVIPMANSLAFGLMLATLLVLILVPTLYSVYGRILGPRLFANEDHSSEPQAEQAAMPELVGGAARVDGGQVAL